MKVIYDWQSLGIMNGIKALWPSKTKKYLMKWMKARDLLDPADTATFYTNRFTGELAIELNFTSRTINDFLPNPLRVHFDSMLYTITLIENMRNAEELCIWLDMKDVA